MPKLIQVIVSEIGRGSGVYPELYRIVTQYHDLDGNFLAENDPTTPSSMAREFVDTAAKIVQEGSDPSGGILYPGCSECGRDHHANRWAGGIWLKYCEN